MLNIHLPYLEIEFLTNKKLNVKDVAQMLQP